MLRSPDLVKPGLCVGCGSCASAMRWDRNGFLQPAEQRVPAEEVAKICPFSDAAPNEDAIAAERFPHAPAIDPAIGRFEAAYVGHVGEPDFRPQGSSGGLTSWVAAELLRSGRVDAVAHVV